MSHAPGKFRFRKILYWGSISVAFFLHLPGFAWSELLKDHKPKICLGYYPEEPMRAHYGKHGKTGSELSGLNLCEKNYGLYSNFTPLGANLSGEHMSFYAICCPLPHSDILTDEHALTATECPPNYVATGSPGEFNPMSTSEIYNMRCTKINTKRYQLGKKRSAVFWGLSSGGLYFWKEKKRIKRRELPAAIRFGISRGTKWYFRPSGCVGEPFGSLLVEKTSKRCQGFNYRELQYKGNPGDPPAGTMVKMFPDCKDIDDVLSDSPKCIK